MERRELLYSVVRDAMVRAGVLSASYKFKVLSLDQKGRQFLIMMDLAREFGGETVRLSEIEALIAQTAKTRHDIQVTAVYWRINDHVAVGNPQQGIASHGAPLSAPRVPQAAPPMAPPVEQAPVVRARPDAPAPRSAQRFDPIEADEVAAFKRALADTAGTPRATPAAAVQPGGGVPSRSLLQPRSTGFEDTEITEDPGTDPALGSTQYGELR